MNLHRDKVVPVVQISVSQSVGFRPEALPSSGTLSEMEAL